MPKFKDIATKVSVLLKKRQRYDKQSEKGHSLPDRL